MKTQETKDFGEKIGGARKDFYHRALNIADLNQMNDAEKIKLVKKDNVWPRQDPVKLVDDGLPQEIAYWRNEVRKALPPTAKDCDPENYIKVVSEVRDYVEAVTDKNGVSGFFDFLQNKYLTRVSSYYYNTTPEASGIITNKMLRIAKYPYQRLEREAKQKLFGISKEKQLETFLRQNLIIKRIGDEVTVGKDFGNQTVATVSTYLGKRYFYPRKGSEMNDLSSWVDGRYAILNYDNHEILSNSEKTEKDAKTFVDSYIAMKLAVTNNIEDKKKPRKTKFPIPEIKDAQRIGPKYRQSDTVTGEDIMSFGIRGGEFGVWLEDADAKESLVKTYDAFMDLARMLGIDKKSISNGGTLAIAFGARGKGGSGAAAAHYEPMRKVINLTKYRGAGCLAHEWAHALDDSIGKMSGLSTTQYGTMASKATSRERKLLPKSFLDLMDAMNWKMQKPDEEKWEAEIQHKIARWKKQFRMAARMVTPADLQVNEQQEWQKALDAVWDARERTNSLNYTSIPGLRKKNPNDFTLSEIETLSALRKKFTGRGIKKDMKNNLNVPLVQAKLLEEELKRGVKAVRVKTDFKQGSEMFDRTYSKHSNGYWSSDCEMFARAFDCYVSDKLKKGLYVNEYLTGHANCYVMKKEGESIYAIPTGHEREVIFEKFDELIEDMKNKGWFSRKDWSTEKTYS